MKLSYSRTMTFRFYFLCQTFLAFALVVTQALCWSKLKFTSTVIIQRLHSATSLEVSQKESYRRNGFIVDIFSPVNLQELSNENLVKIVNLDACDMECNYLCWKCLGYRYNNLTQIWENDHVFPRWKEKYPHPPDLIGVKRIYDPVVDQPVRDASVPLIRSIPRDFKGGVRNLTHFGFQPYKLAELTPNKTRRAQMVSWLIYFREKLFGRGLEELMQERSSSSPENENLPSEIMYQKNMVV